MNWDSDDNEKPMRTIIEIGANRGTDTERFLKDSNNTVYAFEPTPELHLELKEKFKHYKNYFPVPLAVDLVNGWSWFNISGNLDWGCSSIHKFHPDINVTWPSRTDFIMTDRCRVQTIRLDTFMDTYNIGKVDYLWCDAQGNDFCVLQSLGDRISDIKEGLCEVSVKAKLYDGPDNSAEIVQPWLEERGFKCNLRPDKITDFNPDHYEGDILFVRK